VSPPRILTISQLAGYAGVTVRTVRHYHAYGLLPEPARDASGYRRYGADDIIALVRIKTLAASGVPLARIQGLLGAEPDEFGAALADIDADLRRRIAELRRHRADLARLPSVERLCVPEEVAALFDRMRAIGISERTVAMERDGWILLSAAYPEIIPETLEWRRRSLDDPAYQAFMLRMEEAFDWDADDPRLEVLADDTVELMLEIYPIDVAAVELPKWQPLDADRYRLVSEHNLDASPAWARLNRLVEDRARRHGYPVP
jgi:DNA-binding transcriptional MerR regulator